MKVNKFTAIDPRGNEISLDTETSHPEGKIELLDGSLIEGFPRQTPTEEVDNKLQLDTSGEYLQIRSKKPLSLEEQEALKKEREKKEKLFYENAYFFFINKEKILSDSRMFLTPIPVVSGIAYTGTSGFRNPTLGIYIEWWTFYGASRSVSEDGTTNLLWYIAGSPLSGSNRCSAVDDKGKAHTVSVPSFHDTWRSFVAINTRYDECKEKYEAYSLEKTLDILKSEPVDENIYTHLQYEMRIEGLERNIAIKKNSLKLLDKEKNSIWNKYIKFRVSVEFKRLKKLFEQYYKMAKLCEEKIEEQNAHRREVKAHKEDYTPKEFQKEMMGAQRQKRTLEEELRRFTEEGTKEIFPNGEVTFGSIEYYVTQITKEQNS